MSFFLSSTSSNSSQERACQTPTESASRDIDPSWFVQPDSTDICFLREIEIQRYKWKDFIKTKKSGVWGDDMDWLWKRDRENKKSTQLHGAKFLKKKFKLGIPKSILFNNHRNKQQNSDVLYP